MRVVPIAAEALTAVAFAPFGWLPVADTDPADGDHSLTFAWGDAHLNIIGHAYGEIEHTDAGAPLCTRLYRHESHTQVLMPMNVDAVVAVARAGTEFSAAEALEGIRAFLVRRLDCFVLHRGTWHWGPFPLGREAVRLLNVQGRGYVRDNESVDLDTTLDAAVEIVVS